MGGPILIVGAGIGGLTAAHALRTRGFEVRVLERAPALAAVGAGITVQINAMRALAGIGLAERVAKAGIPMDHGELRRSDGRVLAAFPVGTLAAELGQPMVGILRADLQEVLRADLPDDTVRCGAPVTAFHDSEGGIEAELAGGERVAGRVLVGCDGLRSSVRTQLLGDGEARYAGYTSWRGVTAEPVAPTARFSGEIWGRGLRFGAIPVTASAVYWFAVANAPPDARDPAGGTRTALEAHFGSWAEPVPTLIAATPESAILRTDIRDRPPSTRWGRGRVTLLGDAAHPMTPNLGQGGCQAIEDAVVLAEHLAASPEDPTAGLRAYERARVPRTASFVRDSRRIGRIGQLANPVACALRNAVFGNTPAGVVERQMRARFRFPA